MQVSSSNTPNHHKAEVCLIEKEGDLAQFNEFMKQQQEKVKQQLILKGKNYENISTIVVTKSEEEVNNNLKTQSQIQPQNANLFLLQNYESCIILGVDCEGLSRTQPLSLVQIGNEDKCFLFDILKLNGLPKCLKNVLEDPDIIKIFHDFCEDTAALVQQYNVHCDRVFDTQIAHRIINQDSDEPRDQNISLNHLLKEYIQVENDQKETICSYMKKEPGFWWQRPLSQIMQEYAAQDVIFLPSVYGTMMRNFFLENLNQCSNRIKQSGNYTTSPEQHRYGQKLWSFDSSSNRQNHFLSPAVNDRASTTSTSYDSNQSLESGNKSNSYQEVYLGDNYNQDPFTAWDQFCNVIYEKTQLCERYAYINNKIPIKFDLKKGSTVKAFLKNFQQFGIYCSLNLGVSGYVSDPETVNNLKAKFQIGDIIDLQVSEDFSSEINGQYERALIYLEMPVDPASKQKQLQRALFSCLAAVANNSSPETENYLLAIPQTAYRLTSYSDFGHNLYNEDMRNQNGSGFYFGIDNHKRLEPSHQSIDLITHITETISSLEQQPCNNIEYNGHNQQVWRNSEHKQRKYFHKKEQHYKQDFYRQSNPKQQLKKNEEYSEEYYFNELKDYRVETTTKKYRKYTVDTTSNCLTSSQKTSPHGIKDQKCKDTNKAKQVEQF
eukprot:403346454